jgi:predicted dehydrogenase
MNICIIGAGKMGETHLEMYKTLGIGKKIYIIDTNRKRGLEVAKKHNVIFENDFKKLFSKSKIDVCDICVPTYLHLYYIKIAVKLSADIIVEKPAVLNYKESLILSKIINNYPRVFMTAYSERFFKPFVLLKDFCKNSNRIIRFSFRRWGVKPKSKWYSDNSKSGGVLLDLAIHDIDFLCLITHHLKHNLNVCGVKKTSIGNKSQNIEIIIKINKSGLGNISTSWLPPSDQIQFYNGFELVTDKGFVSYDSLSSSMKINQKILKISQQRYPDSYQEEIKAFLKKIKTRNFNNKKEMEIILKTMNLIEEIKKLS